MTHPRLIKVCHECGGEYSTSANQAAHLCFCPACQQIREDASRARRHQRALNAEKHMTYKVLLCPDDSFPRGAMFSALEVSLTAAYGYFAPGTVFEHRIRQGHEFMEVVGGMGHRQSLKGLKKEA